MEDDALCISVGNQPLSRRHVPVGEPQEEQKTEK
jgi:hypothetical protein